MKTRKIQYCSELTKSETNLKTGTNVHVVLISLKPFFTVLYIIQHFYNIDPKLDGILIPKQKLCSLVVKEDGMLFSIGYFSEWLIHKVKALWIIKTYSWKVLFPIPWPIYVFTGIWQNHSCVGISIVLDLCLSYHTWYAFTNIKIQKKMGNKNWWIEKTTR